MSLLERLEVPAAKSRASTRATRRPRLAASRAAPVPVEPAADHDDVERLGAHPLEVGRALRGAEHSRLDDVGGRWACPGD